jgi:hypothetical protein
MITLELLTYFLLPRLFFYIRPRSEPDKALGEIPYVYKTTLKFCHFLNEKSVQIFQIWQSSICFYMDMDYYHHAD